METVQTNVTNNKFQFDMRIDMRNIKLVFQILKNLIQQKLRYGHDVQFFYTNTHGFIEDKRDQERVSTLTPLTTTLMAPIKPLQAVHNHHPHSTNPQISSPLINCTLQTTRTTTASLTTLPITTTFTAPTHHHYLICRLSLSPSSQTHSNHHHNHNRK